jgi:hypothetical protein
MEDACITKLNSILTKTVRGPSIKAAQGFLAMCPSSLQTSKMLGTAAIKAAIPLVDGMEWEQYVTLPAQTPPPSTTAGRIAWWRARQTEFPTLDTGSFFGLALAGPGEGIPTSPVRHAPLATAC